MAVVDQFKAVEIDVHQNGLRAIALHIGERAFKFAFKPAAIENIEQRIDIGARFQLPNARARNGNLAPEPFDFGQ